MYDDRNWDVSLPDSMTEEFLACVHILYRLAGIDDREAVYKFVDKWMFTECEELEGIVPVQMIVDGEGLVVLEYLRDVENQHRINNGEGLS
jgi:peroxiredoxin